MNFTLDDTSPSVAYSPSWTVQANSDPERAEFFQATYHATQVDGAQLNMSVTGSAFYLYGSKGPGHGNYSVQYDGVIVLLSAYADSTAYRQVLFSHAFDPKSTSPHFISLTARLAGPGVHGSWLDFDYVVFTTPLPPSPSTTAISANAIASLTAVPPWLTIPSSSSKPLSSTEAVPSSSSSFSTSQKSRTKIPIILASLFGSIIFLALVCLVVYCMLRRLYQSRRAQEHDFRYGQSSVVNSQSVLTRALNASNVVPQGSVQGTGKLNNTHAGTPPSSPGFGSVVDGSAMPASMNGKAISTASAASSSAATPHANSTSTPFAFLATAPALAFNLGQRKNKGDADSLRTDFLQV